MPGVHPIAPENVTLGQLYILILDQKHELAVQGKRIEDLTGELALARKENAEVLVAFQSTRGAWNFLKFLAATATALAAIYGLWALIKGSPAEAVEVFGLVRRG